MFDITYFLHEIFLERRVQICAPIFEFSMRSLLIFLIVTLEFSANSEAILMISFLLSSLNFGIGNLNPMLVSGTLNGASSLVISQDPKKSDSVEILRSNNQSGGMEFTWSVWVYINDVKVSEGADYSVIFNKGNGTFYSEGPYKGMSTVTSGPGLYLDNKASQEGRVNMVVAMSTVSTTNARELMVIKDVPLQKWFHCAIRLENTTLDAYINGTITNRIIMQDVPAQNYEDVYICSNGGFNGNISNLQYFDSALSVFQINNIVVWGRNAKASGAGASDDASGFPYYLSNLWYNANY